MSVRWNQTLELIGPVEDQVQVGRIRYRLDVFEDDEALTVRGDVVLAKHAGGAPKGIFEQ